MRACIARGHGECNGQELLAPTHDLCRHQQTIKRRQEAAALLWWDGSFWNLLSLFPERRGRMHHSTLLYIAGPREDGRWKRRLMNESRTISLARKIAIDSPIQISKRTAALLLATKLGERSWADGGEISINHQSRSCNHGLVCIPLHVDHEHSAFYRRSADPSRTQQDY